jgi:hypothetical protein
LSEARTRLHSPQPHFARRWAKVTPGRSFSASLDARIGLGGRAGVEMDRHAIARGRQALGLPDDGVGVLVAQKDEGDLGHARRGSAQVSFLIAPSLAHGD